MTGRIPGRVRLLRALRAAPNGLHTLSIRQDLRIGNPAERVHDLRLRGFVIDTQIERRHGCHGVRHRLVKDLGDSMAWLTDHQLDAEVDGGAVDGGAKSPAAAVDLSAESTPALPLPSGGAPTLAWIRDFDGKWTREPYDFEGWGPPKQLEIEEAA